MFTLHEVFNAKTGRTIVVVPACLSLLVCMVLDTITGTFHDHEAKH